MRKPPRSHRDQVLAEQSGPRTRVLDEHMYRVDGTCSTTRFRLQLFTSDAGLRPVAVATQCLDDRSSLVNSAETVVSRVWRDHFADEPMPPLWVQRLVLDDDPDDVLGDWQMVSFAIGPDYELSEPVWPRLTQQQVDELVGGLVDADRGAGFVAPPPPPSYRTRYRPVPMSQMPIERPFRETCMKSAPGAVVGRWWRRLVDVLPSSKRRTGGRECCWYHGGDWAEVIDVAVRLVDENEASGIDDDGLRRQVLAAARGEGLSGWRLQALDSLIHDPISIHAATKERPAVFVNGQHRTRAMRDAAVSAVLVGFAEEVDPA